MDRLAKQKVDLFLSGHLHVTHIGDTTMRYNIADYSGLIVQAGTAISSRSRGEPVSFNVIEIDSLNVTIHSYSGQTESDDYALAATHKYKNKEGGWKIVE
jgi:3',5'-cyclic AMP phosphodiesterase CpdA